MPFAGQNFVLLATGNPFLSGTTTVTPPVVLPLSPGQALEACNAAPPTGSGVASGFANNSATPIDRVIFDLALTSIAPSVGNNLLPFGTFVGSFSKNGALYVTCTGTTPVTINLTSLATPVGVVFSQAGDSVLAVINALIVKNISNPGSTFTIAPGASNPSRMPPLSGTTPSITLQAGDVYCQSSAIGLTVDSTHNTITFTPTAGGALLLAWGGF
jgi:hypothetical protein